MMEGKETRSSILHIKGHFPLTTDLGIIWNKRGLLGNCTAAAAAHHPLHSKGSVALQDTKYYLSTLWPHGHRQVVNKWRCWGRSPSNPSVCFTGNLKWVLSKVITVKGVNEEEEGGEGVVSLTLICILRLLFEVASFVFFWENAKQIKKGMQKNSGVEPAPNPRGQKIYFSDIYPQTNFLTLLLLSRFCENIVYHFPQLKGKRTSVPVANSMAPNPGLRSSMADCAAALQLQKTPWAVRVPLRPCWSFTDHSRIQPSQTAHITRRYVSEYFCGAGEGRPLPRCLQPLSVWSDSKVPAGFEHWGLHLLGHPLKLQTW